MIAKVTPTPAAIIKSDAIAVPVGAAERTLARELSRLLGDQDYYRSMSRNHNPYGDGMAAVRIVRAIANSVGAERHELAMCP